MVRTNNRRKESKGLYNFIWVGLGFGAFYWLLESFRDVFVFNKGHVLGRILFPDMMSFWMRILVVCLLVLLSVYVQSLRERMEYRRKKPSRSFLSNNAIKAGVCIGILYWILESVRDVLVFERGPFIERIISPDPMAFWMRLLAVCIIMLFSVYAQALINERKRKEESLRREREQLERVVEKRTAELSKSNKLLVLLKKEIAERKRIEEEKLKMQAQLIQAKKMEAVGILAGGIAHDFNNLMTVIIGCADMSMMDIPETEPVYSDLKEIRVAAVRATDLTSQLLLFSRKKPMQFSLVNLNQTVRDLLKMLHRLIGEDIQVITDFELNLWPILADKGTISQVIMNLAVNARDAMPKGGRLLIGTKNVLVSESDSAGVPDARPGKFVRVSVSDTGVGMDKESLQHIFDPFFSTKDVGKGTGLGLAVVYGIVNKHKGWIQVASEPGHGSTFNVYFEANPGNVKDEPQETAPMKKHSSGKGKRILLVEDEEKVREFTATGLSRNGYVVFSAANAEEAMRIFRREEGSFRFVLSDVVLPGKSGLELVEEFVSVDPSISVLLSSGYPDDRSQRTVIQKRGYRFLKKPYALEHLLQVIRELDA